MRAFIVKVKTPSGERIVEVRATGQKDAARKALWHFLPGAEVVWVMPRAHVPA
jgi:hypothetical protein